MMMISYKKPRSPLTFSTISFVSKESEYRILGNPKDNGEDSPSDHVTCYVRQAVKTEIISYAYVRTILKRYYTVRTYVI